MIPPPSFSSADELAARIGDLELWAPYVVEVLRRHELYGDSRELVAGYDPTHPTFVCGEVVVKLFAHATEARARHAAERAAHRLLATDPGIRAPRLLAEGELFGGGDAPCPYLVTSRVRGRSWAQADPTDRERRALAADLGEQVRRVHALNPAGIAPAPRVEAPELRAALRRSALPARWIPHVGEFVARLGPPELVFVHGDLVAAHAFTDGGRLAGIIDWGDAAVADRHYELGKLHFDAFAGDRELLRVFLEASEWPRGADFARRTLGAALHRQAVGLTQHRSFDVFDPLPGLLPLGEIDSLDDLAVALFES